jgi:hypothetical protein
MDKTFEEHFRNAQQQLGLTHYHVSFVEGPLDGLYADMDADPEDCVATVRYDLLLNSKDGATEASAVHEVIHLLLADLKYALESSPKATRVEEERVARRLEAVVVRGLRRNI